MLYDDISFHIEYIVILIILGLLCLCVSSWFLGEFTLRQILTLLKLDLRNFDTIKDYLTQVDMYRVQLKDCGEPIKDGKLIKHVMTHLLPKYETFFSIYNTS